MHRLTKLTIVEKEVATNSQRQVNVYALTIRFIVELSQRSLNLRLCCYGIPSTYNLLLVEPLPQTLDLRTSHHLRGFPQQSQSKF
jgi:hypothetical protein